MDDKTRSFEPVAWAAAEGRLTEADLALIEADPVTYRRTLERLLDDTEDNLESVRQIEGPERAQAVADFEQELAQLEAVYERLMGTADPTAAVMVADPLGVVVLQASWSGGQIVVWASGPDAIPADNDGLADRLEAIGGPALGWNLHADVPLPNGTRAEALSIPVADALGWLVAMGGGLGRDAVGSSVIWLGRVALAAVRQVASGAVVPALKTTKQPGGRALDLNVRWVPALVDTPELAELMAAVPGPITALAPAEPRAVTLEILGAVVDAIVREAAGRLELPASPPVTRTASAVAEAVVTRLDGSTFSAPASVGAEMSKRLDRWAKPVTAASRSRLVVQLDPPDSGNAWFLSVLGPGAEGGLLPVEVALADSPSTKPMADELARLERILPVLSRAGGLRRGQVYLDQSEAWELMTVTGPLLTTAGFDVRVPSLSRRKPNPALRLFTEPTGESVVGAHQLSNVRWSVVFDDVELTAADVARLAAEARPLVRSHGRWVELDRVDLKEAAAALEERAAKTQMSGAEILRAAVGLEGSPLSGGISIEGEGWATSLLDKARTVPTEPIPMPEGFVGELRAYQAEALGWMRFLDAAELGGCLALDMGLGQDADGARPPGPHRRRRGRARHRPAGRGRQLGGRGAQVHPRPPGRRPPRRIAGIGRRAPGRGGGRRPRHHHLRHRSPRRRGARRHVPGVGSCSTRRRPSRTRRARPPSSCAASRPAPGWRSPAPRSRTASATSGPSSTSPTRASSGPRPAFVAQLAGEGESALRALNGILVFRRTKSEPAVAAELPDRIDELDHCTMTAEQIGLYQAVLDGLITNGTEEGGEPRKGAILAAITALKQICNHPAAYQDDGRPLAGRSGKLSRLEEIVESVFAAGERILVFTHFAEWGKRLADHLTDAHRGPGRLLPRRARPRRPRQAGRRSSRRARAPAPWCSR